MADLLLNSRQGMCEIAVVAMVCVLSVFFVPLAHGPYSVVHGPTTALRSLRHKVQVVLSMWLAALCLLALTPLLGSTPRFSAGRFLGTLVPPEWNGVLRC